MAYNIAMSIFSGLFFMKNGTTSRLGSKWPWLDRMTYRPFRGAHRGYWYRLPWNRNKF